MGVVEYAKNLAASIPQNNGFTMSPALLGAAGSVINGALGFFGQQSANKTNLKIARETNAANRANQEYQNEWNLDMWNKQNEYNSPAAQRQRLEAAGLNPIFNGLDGVSEAGQLQSADYVATPGAPMLNSGEFLGNGIGNAMKTMAEIKLLDAQAKKTNEETKGVSLGNQILSAQKPALIENEFVMLSINKSVLDMKPLEKEKLSKDVDYLSEQISTAKTNREVLEATRDQIKTQISNDTKLTNAKVDDLYDQISMRFMNYLLEDRKVSIDEMMYWPEVQRLLSEVDINEQTLYDLKTQAIQRFFGYERQARQDNANIDKTLSEIGVNKENARLIGKKADMYVYEVVLDGVKTLILSASLLLKK